MGKCLSLLKLQKTKKVIPQVEGSPVLIPEGEYAETQDDNPKETQRSGGGGTSDKSPT